VRLWEERRKEAVVRKRKDKYLGVVGFSSGRIQGNIDSRDDEIEQSLVKRFADSISSRVGLSRILRNLVVTTG
jgi:hypothetical protein